MELRQVRYFVAVARQSSFTRAAAQIGVAQPSLSQQIRALELELGVSLFDRTQRTVQLTAAGNVFLQQAERLLAVAAETQIAMHEFTALPRGHLALGTLATLAISWLPAQLGHFQRRYPDIAVSIHEGTTESLGDLLTQGKLDLALVAQADTARSDLAQVPLFSDKLAVIVAADHPLANRGPVDLSALREEPWIVPPSGAVSRQRLLDASAAAGFTPRIVHEVPSALCRRALVAEGIGTTVMPRALAISAGPTVAEVTVESPALRRTIMLAWRTEAVLSGAAVRLRAFLSNTMHKMAL